jgi:hypothetical protein
MQLASNLKLILRDWAEEHGITKRKIVRRGPRKLTLSLIKRFAASIRETGGPIDFHCQALGIGRTTYHEWRQEAEANTAPIYRQFVEAVDRAQGQRLKMLYVAAEHAKPHEILFRQFPELFPSEATRLQLTGKDDESLFPAPFSVILELNSDSPPLPEKEFVIEQMGGPNDGQRSRWQLPPTNGAPQ